MDWTRAIERNLQALEAIIASISALLATAEGASRISRPLHRAILRILHPAEAALRRLIVIAARGLVAKPHRPRPMPKLPLNRSAVRRPSFRLFDPRKAYSFEPSPAAPKLVPRIHIFDRDPRIVAWWPKPEPPSAPALPRDDGLVDVRPVARRIEALKMAFSDVPRQARRLVQLRARRATNPSLPWRSPLRLGPPPGGRKIAVHDVDFVLRECHALAFDALKANTS